MQSEKCQILSEKDSLGKAYEALLEEHRQLQSNYDDVLSERDDISARFNQASKDVENRRSEKTDTLMKAEIDRLRTDL